MVFKLLLGQLPNLDFEIRRDCKRDPFSNMHRYTWRATFEPRLMEHNREFKIYDASVAITSLKIASSSFSIYFAITLVCLTFES